MTKVTVVIPCYNGGAYIEEAVDSVLAQTYSDVEIIIVDDGSNDPHTQHKLSENRWERTRVLRQENQGPAAARNLGIRNATGEYILPLDADDRIAPSYIEKAVSAMSEESAGIVYCKAIRFGAENGPWDLPTFSIEEMVIDNVIFCTALFRKEDWKKVGGYTESLRYGMEDYDFWLKLLAIGTAVYRIEEHLFYYRVQKYSRTVSFLNDKQAVVDTYAEIFRNNIGFFAKHADVMYLHRFGLYNEIHRLRKPLEKVQNYMRIFPNLHAFARKLYRLWTES